MAPRVTSVTCNEPSHPAAAAAVAKSLQSCPTLCDPIDGSPPGSTIPGILQVRTLDWVAMLVGNNKPGLKSGLNLKKLNSKPSKSTNVSKKLTMFANSAKNNL